MVSGVIGTALVLDSGTFSGMPSLTAQTTASATATISAPKPPNARHHPRPCATYMRGIVVGRRVHDVVVPPRVAKRHTVNLKIRSEVTRREHRDVRQRMCQH